VNRPPRRGGPRSSGDQGGSDRKGHKFPGGNPTLPSAAPKFPFALTLRGAWRYLEHDWISRTGDIVHETPGSVHTLVLVEESEVFFVVEGALEYLDTEGRTLAHEDWRSMTHKYVDFCSKKGLDVVDISRPRILAPDRVAVA